MTEGTGAPERAEQIEQVYDYVVVGAGVAAAAAAKTISGLDPDGTLVVLGAEPFGPAYRPDLSKTLWLNPDARLEHARLLPEDSDIELVTDATVVDVDARRRLVALENGNTYRYGQLLLATGAAPVRLDSAEESDRIIYFRTVADYLRLRELAQPDAPIIVVGGGYIGAEIASALAQNGVDVTLVMSSENVQDSLFPEDLAAAVTARFVEAGVHVIGNSRITAIETRESGDGVVVTTADGKRLQATAAVLGLGVTANDELGESAGATVDDGILVDKHLKTGAKHVWAAGDVANYPDALLGRRRVEHVDQAEHSGQVAGANMVAAQTDGKKEAYDYTPIFWSDLFEYGYEAMGELDSGLDTVENLKDDFSAGVVYYLREGHVVGALLWNVWDSTDRAREIIARTATTPMSPDELRSAIEF